MKNFNLKNYKNIIPVAFLFSTLIFPVLTQAFQPLVPCDGVDVKCDINQLILMIGNIINWILSIAGIIFTISLIWGGFLYVTSGAKPANKDRAKTILLSTLWGFVIILISWLIVYTILTTLTTDGSNGFLFKYIGNGN